MLTNSYKTLNTLSFKIQIFIKNERTKYYLKWVSKSIMASSSIWRVKIDHQNISWWDRHALRANQFDITSLLSPNHI
jgi:hypothetical protein